MKPDTLFSPLSQTSTLSIMMSEHLRLVAFRRPNEVFKAFTAEPAQKCDQLGAGETALIETPTAEASHLHPVEYSPHISHTVDTLSKQLQVILCSFVYFAFVFIVFSWRTWKFFIHATLSLIGYMHACGSTLKLMRGSGAAG